MSLILSETRERLLKAIIAQVPPERIAEIHFFAPIKQGGVESGVAVVAAVPESVAVIDETPGTDEGAEEQRDAEEAAEASEEDAAHATAEETVDVPAEASSEHADEVAAEETTEVAAEETTEGAGDEAPEAVAEEATEENVDSAAEPVVDVAAGDQDVGTPDLPAPDASSKRHVIYTARYRYTLKGPDRGKWETNVKAEADAPLITVETVVRGVQRRAGDNDEPERVTGNEIRTVTNAWAAAAAGIPGTAPVAR